MLFSGISDSVLDQDVTLHCKHLLNTVILSSYIRVFSRKKFSCKIHITRLYFRCNIYNERCQGSGFESLAAALCQLPEAVNHGITSQQRQHLCGTSQRHPCRQPARHRCSTVKFCRDIGVSRSYNTASLVVLDVRAP